MPEARPTFVVRSPRLIHPLKITGLAELARLVLNPQMPPTCMPVAPLPVFPPSSDVRAASLVRRSSTTPLLAKASPDHAHRHADVACRAVERHRGVVDDIAHGSVVDHAGQNAAVGAFRGFDRQRTGGVEDEIFDDGSGAQCAEESPCAVGSRVVAYHVEITDRVPLPVEEAREWTSRLDRQCVGARQRTDRIADRCPRFDAGHVDVVEQYDEASFILPGARLSPALTAAANSMRSSAVSIPPGDAKA